MPDRDREQKRASGKPGAQPTAAKRASCLFCRDNVDEIDYKNAQQLRRIVSDRGKIRSGRSSGVCRRHQTQISAAVKRAREMALLPYVQE